MRAAAPFTRLWYNRPVRAPGLPILDRYLIRELLGPFLVALVLFTFFLLIDRIYHLTDLVITKGVPFHLVLQLLVFMLPSFLTLSLPMALLVAVLLAGGRLAGDLEIVACQAAGIGLLRLFRPVLMAALAVALIGALFAMVLAPLAGREFQRQLFKILKTRAVSGIKERVFNTTFPGITIYVEEVSPSRMALRGVLLSDERNPKLSRIITRPRGTPPDRRGEPAHHPAPHRGGGQRGRRRPRQRPGRRASPDGRLGRAPRAIATRASPSTT